MLDEFELSIGDVFDYPLLGGEKLYDLFYTLNNKFGLTMNATRFQNSQASVSKTDGLITLTAVSNDSTEWYTFKNMKNVGVPDIQEIGYLSAAKSTIIQHKPFYFAKEMVFLKTIPINIMVNCYGVSTNVNILYRYIRATCPVKLPDESQDDRLILRYYGYGDNVPSIYGTYDTKQLVAIIELKRQNTSTLHCLRNRIYHVYNNGYRSRD